MLNFVATIEDIQEDFEKNCYIPFLIILELFVNVYSSLKPSFNEFIKWPLAYSTKDLFMLNKDLITRNGSSRMEK